METRVAFGTSPGYFKMSVKEAEWVTYYYGTFSK